ncbi:F-box protein At4g12382-like [Bidens hawaiensis]|uniref:F-box protein At4g12382-like n=1 Tax=Bidens hawaiensis TaxID=980011 RepID=UPI0040496353
MLECRLEVDYCKSKKEEKDKDVEIVIRQVKPDETKSDSESESHLLNVPFHILEMIMERCVGVEYMRFRATCKLCCLAAPSIQWGNERTLRKWQMYSVVSPWLMVLHNYAGIITFDFIDPICGDEYLILKPRKLANDCQICYSMYGWLLLLDRFNMELPQMWFFNPFTSEVIQLPIMPDDFRTICFSAPPTSPDCMLVGFTRQHAQGRTHVV